MIDVDYILSRDGYSALLLELLDAHEARTSVAWFDTYPQQALAGRLLREDILCYCAPTRNGRALESSAPHLQLTQRGLVLARNVRLVMIRRMVAGGAA